MTKITITTTRGAKVDLIDNSGIEAWINGKRHTSMGVDLRHDKVVGDYIALSCNAKAAISPETAVTVRDFLDAAAARAADRIANYKLSTVEFSARLTAAMAGDRSAL